MTTPVKLELVWAESGGTSDPSDFKYQLGWVSEIPTYQNFNYVLNALDKAKLAYAEKDSYPWQDLIAYKAGARVERAGKIYYCILDHNDSVGSNPQDPELDTTRSYWVSGTVFSMKAGAFSVLTNKDGVLIDNINQRDNKTLWEGNDITISNSNAVIALNTTNTLDDNFLFGNVNGKIVVVNVGTHIEANGTSLLPTSNVNSFEVYHEGHKPTQAEVAGTIPSNPLDGVLYGRRNGNWVKVTAIDVQTAPPPPVTGNGSGWYNLDDGTFYVDIDDGDSSQWVPASPPTVPVNFDDVKITSNNSTTPRDLSERFAETICYRDFGAVLDGVTDDTVAVQEAHAEANLRGKTIRQEGGTALVSGEIIIQTSCKFEGGFKFKIVGDFPQLIFKVTPEYSTINLTQSDVSLSEFYKYNNNVSQLDAYPYHFMVVDSNDLDLNRNHGSAQILNKNSVTLLGEGGKLVYPLTTTFNTISGIRLTPTNIKRVIIDNFTCELAGNPVNINSLVEITRNCVTFNNIRYIDNTSNIGQIDLRSLISISYAYDVELNKIRCDAISDGRLDYNYTVVYWKSALINICDLRSFEGWAQLDGNYARDVTVKNSTIDRVGGHYSCWDFTFENIKASRSRCIDISGGGRLDIRNILVTVNHKYLDPADLYVTSIRGDYAAEWDGDILLDGVTIDARGVSSQIQNDTTFTVLGAFQDSSSAGFDYGREVSLAKTITVRNVKFHTNPNVFKKWIVRAVAVGASGAATSPVSYPESITIEDIEMSTKSTAHYHQVVALNYFGDLKPAIRPNYCSVYIENVNNYNPKIAGQNLSTGTTVQVPTVFISANVNNYVETTISNCDWVKLHQTANANDLVKTVVKDSRVYYIGGEFATRYEFSDCKFPGCRFEGTWKGSFAGGVVEDFLKVDGINYEFFGFPNNIENNATAFSGMFMEINSTLFTQIFTPAQLHYGWVSTSYYKPISQYRSGASAPNGVVTPLHIDEEYLDTSSGQYNFWKATGLANTNWKQIT